MADRSEFTNDLLARIAEGESIDWEALEAQAGSDSLRATIREMRVIAAVAELGRTPDEDIPSVRSAALVGGTWGHLKILAKIGAGAYGDVYRAWDSRLDREVALKLLRDPAPDGDFASSVIDEGRMLARVRHPGVVTVYGAERIGGRVGIWMEYVDGQTLEEIVRAEGPLATAAAIRTTLAVCQALAAVHAAGLLHRDVKAQNVVRADDGRIVLMDFGTGQDLRARARLPALAGTPLYVAPEVLDGAPATVASDLYSLGVLLFFLLTGTHPVPGATLAEVRAGHEGAQRRRSIDRAVQAPLRAALTSALSPDPALRPASATDLADLLAAAAPRSTASRVPRAFVAALLLLLASVFGLATMARPNFVFESRDWVLVVPLENRTGDPTLAGLVDGAMYRELTSSAFVNVVSETRVADSLRLLNLNPDTPLTEELARRVAVRDGRIRAIVTGRVVNSGSQFVLRAAAIDPVSGDRLVTVQDLAADARDIGTIARRLSNALRRSLGEPEAQIRETNEQLEPVASRSGQAVRLYNESYRLGTRGEGRTWEGARALVEQALAIDPDFPAARIWHAWSLYRDSRQIEARQEAQRALEIADRASPWEQHWIRASYHHLRGNRDAAVEEYEALLRLRPDHYWGVQNLVGVYSGLGRADDARMLAVKWAAMRPNHAGANARAIAMLIQAGEREHAAPYVTQLARIIDGREDNEQAPHWPVVTLYDIYLALLRGDAASARAAADGAGADLTAAVGELRLNIARTISLAYLNLGRLADARRFAGEVTPPMLRAVHLARIELVAGRPDVARAHIGGFTADGFHAAVGNEQFVTSMHLALWTMVGAGLVEEAERQLEAWEARTDGRRPNPYQAGSLRARIAMARGKVDAAERGLREALVSSGEAPLARVRFLEPLTEILRRRGDRPGEREALERAVAALDRMEEPATHIVLPMQVRLAALLRAGGDLIAARDIEAQVARMLAEADADLPVLVALKKQQAQDERTR